MTDFGTRLKAARKDKKLTQKALANQLGVEQSTVSNYENNFRFPIASALKDIADQLEVSVDYLLGRSESEGIKINPEASEEVSGPFLSRSGSGSEDLNDSSKKTDLMALQSKFLERLIQGNYQEAETLVLEHKVPGATLMDYYEVVFAPTLKAAGDLWASGEISVADEHLISAGIDRLMARLELEKNQDYVQTTPYAAVLMLPGAEEHEFPLKMTAEVFKRHGWMTYYLGKSIPVSSLEALFQKKKVHVLVLSVTLSLHLNSCESLVRAVRSLALDLQPKIIVGGSAIENEDHALNQLGADYYLPTLQALESALEELEKGFEST